MEIETVISDQYGAPKLEEGDKYICKEVLIPGLYVYQRATIDCRNQNSDGELIRCFNANPTLDKKLYEAVLLSEKGVEVSANQVDKYILTLNDAESNKFIKLRDILDHGSNYKSIWKEYGFVHSPNTSLEESNITKGWYLQVEWVDWTNKSEIIANLKESYPMQVAEHSKSDDLINDSSFSRWCPTYFWKLRRVISKVKSHFWKRTHKYGILVTKSVEEAVWIDNEKNNTLCWYSMDKEITNKIIVFDVKEEGEEPPWGYKDMKSHMIFGVNIDSAITIMVRFFVDGHKFDTPTSMTYTSILSK